MNSVSATESVDRAMACKTSIIAALSVILAGCGGGSGSGSASTGPAGQVPPGQPAWTSEYSGNRDPAAISRDSAARLASLAFYAFIVPEIYEGMWLPNPLGSGTGDIDEVVAGPDGGSAVVTGHIEQNYEGFLDVDFRNFAYDGTVIDGRYKQTYGAGDAGRMEFINLNITANSDQIVFTGTTDIAKGRQHVDVNLVISWPAYRQQVYLENVAIEFSGTDINGHRVGQREISGTIYEDPYGSITVESNGPIVAPKFDDRADSFIATRGGGFYISGNGPLLQFRALSRQFAALALDTDDDGFVDEAYRITWRELFQRDDPQPVATDGPIANAGGTAYGTLGTPVNVHGFFSHDDDGDWLSYEWRLVAKPLGSKLQSGIAAGPEFAFTPDATGDYVVGLRVTDGTNASETSVVALIDTHANRGTAEEPSTGNIEITSAVAVGGPITVDARSAANIPYGGLGPDWSAFGPGSVSVVATDEPYIAELVTAQAGRFIVGMRENGWSPGVEEAHRFVTVVVGAQDFEVETWLEISDLAIASGIIPFDFNQDGRLDIGTTVFQNEGTPYQQFGSFGFHWLLADDSGGYDAGPILATGEGGMDIGDLNGDGRPDVAVADREGVYIGFQQSAGVLSDFMLYPYSAVQCDTFVSESSVEIGDIDGDARNDVVAMRGCDQSIMFWLQTPGGDLAGPIQLSLATPALDLQAADFNDDARIDLVLGLSQHPKRDYLDQIVVAYGQADGSFELGTPISYVPSRLSRPIVGYLDDNDRPDILVLVDDGYVVLEGQSDGSLVETRASSQILTYFYLNHGGGRAIVADVDNDNDADLVACSGIGILNISYLQADGSYLHIPNGNCRWHDVRNALAVFDFNNDGFNDILNGTDGYFPAEKPPWYFLRVLYGHVSPYSKPAF